MGNRLKNIAVVLFIALFITSLCFNVCFYTTQQKASLFVVSDTTRIVIIDTIPYLEPQPKKEVFTRNVVDKLPIVVPQDTTSQDSAEVYIPITQKVYEDSTYTAYVSGYKQNLDSIFIYPRHEEVTIKKETGMLDSTTKPKRWNVGIHVGYGVTIKETPQFAPYIGVGVSYYLFSF